VNADRLDSRLADAAGRTFHGCRAAVSNDWPWRCTSMYVLLNQYLPEPALGPRANSLRM
jgi:hypothetical protein